MNRLSQIILFLTVLITVSCTKDADPVIPPDELGTLQLVKSIPADDHRVELYTADGKLRTGYNQVFFQIKKPDGSLVSNTTAVTWTPVMQMMGMSHSCPASSIAAKEDAQYTYAGYIIFQMAGNDMEYWELSVDFTLNSTPYTAKDEITVEEASKRVVESFQGSDEKRYILALVEPASPRVAVNDMVCALYRMESMMDFVPVDQYKIRIDPRMPGMGNHSSPNNEDLTWQEADKLYYGKLSLTMTGYWKINLRLEDSAGNVLKGEEVTEANPGSSIYFEIEF